MGQVRDEVFAVVDPGQEDEAVSIQVDFAAQGSQDLQGPDSFVVFAHGVEGFFIGLDNLIQLQQPVFGGKDVDGIRLKLLGVGHVEAKEGGGVEVGGSGRDIQFAFDAGNQHDFAHNELPFHTIYNFLISLI